jgi:hypothetical protein
LLSFASLLRNRASFKPALLRDGKRLLYHYRHIGKQLAPSQPLQDYTCPPPRPPTMFRGRQSRRRPSNLNFNSPFLLLSCTFNLKQVFAASKQENSVFFFIFFPFITLTLQPYCARTRPHVGPWGVSRRSSPDRAGATQRQAPKGQGPHRHWANSAMKNKAWGIAVK